jgi:hypothetical protein
LYLSTTSADKIEGGIAKLRRTDSGRRADNLRQWFDRILGDYADRLLTFDLAAARIAGYSGIHAGRWTLSRLCRCRDRGGNRDRDLNLRHFESLGVNTLNPFDPGRSDLPECHRRLLAVKPIAS